MPHADIVNLIKDSGYSVALTVGYHEGEKVLEYYFFGEKILLFFFQGNLVLPTNLCFCAFSAESLYGTTVPVMTK